MLDAEFPEFRTIETSPLTPQQQQALLERIDRFHAEMVEGGTGPKWERRLGTLGIAMKLYPAAKRALIAEGRKREDVESLPVLQVVLIHSLRQYRDLADDQAKWYSFPYWEVQKPLKEVEERLKNARRSLSSLPFLIETLPAVNKVFWAQARLERKIAALRCVEAIRLYAAAHDSKLPASLGDIKEVPIPVDPVTGKDFIYKAEGDKGTLYAPPPAGETPYADVNTVYYQLTVQR
jgi:hypothetical protein